MDHCQMVPIGARLAELARLRLQYDESRRSVQVPTLDFGYQCLQDIYSTIALTTDFSGNPTAAGCFGRADIPGTA